MFLPVCASDASNELTEASAKLFPFSQILLGRAVKELKWVRPPHHNCPSRLPCGCQVQRVSHWREERMDQGYRPEDEVDQRLPVIRQVVIQQVGGDVSSITFLVAEYSAEPHTTLRIAILSTRSATRQWPLASPQIRYPPMAKTKYSATRTPPPQRGTCLVSINPETTRVVTSTNGR